MTRHALSWMDDHLGEPMLKRVLDAMGPDTFRGRHLAPLEIPSPTGDERSDRIAMQHRLSDLLDGHDDEASRGALEMMVGHGQWIEATALDMLRATGLDAAVAILIAYALSRGVDQSWVNVRIPSFSLTAGPARGDEAQVSFEQDGRVMVRAPIAPQTYWQDDGILVIERPLPNAVCIAMEGRPLKDIVSHPVLDGMPLRITRVATPIGSQRTNLHVDLAPRRVSIGDLTLEGTRPDRRALATSKPPRRRMEPTPSF